MKTKSLTLENNLQKEIAGDTQPESQVKQDAIFFKKERIKSDIAFHKKMILITVISCLALAAFMILM